MKTLIETIAKVTDDPAERLLLMTLIVKEFLNYTRTENDTTTHFVSVNW